MINTHMWLYKNLFLNFLKKKKTFWEETSENGQMLKKLKTEAL